MPTATAPTPPAPAAAAGPIQARLQTARVRLAAQRLLAALSVGAFVVASLAVVMFALSFFGGAAPSRLAPVLIAGAALALVASVVAAATGWPTLARTATLLDRRAGTHDRFHTALEFAGRGSRSPLEDLTLGECARFVEHFPVRQWTPLRAPRSLRFLAVPLLLGGALVAYVHFHPYRAPQPTALDNAVARQAADLKALADRVQQNPESRPPELEKLAEEMKKSAQRLLENATRPDDEKLKAALRELSSLEAMLQAMKAASREQKSSPEEMAALTAALAANEQTRAAAEALKAGDPAQAAAQLEKLLQQLARQGDAAQTLQQLAQSMQEQAAKLTEQQKSEVAQQMQQAAQAAQSGQPQLSQKSLERLAQLLRQMGGSKGDGKSQPRTGPASRGGQGAPMTEQQLQQLISALENMKQGLQQPGQGGESDGGGGKPGDPSPGGGSLAMVESFAKNGGNDDAGTNPSGQPGSELDKGHSEKIFGDKPLEPTPGAGAAKRLNGMPGEGESLQELVNTAGDSSKAGRAYRQLYEAAAPSAQDAVEQENIPLGSRAFVRRYFENIRPQN